MKIESQVNTFEQGKELKRLGLALNCHYFWNDAQALVNGLGPDVWGNYPAFSVSELLKMLPFKIYYEGNDYFMSFGHGNKGYRVIYETNKLDLIFNLDGDLDREKKALFSTSRSGKTAAYVLAEYLRMLIDSNSGVHTAEMANERLNNAI